MKVQKGKTYLIRQVWQYGSDRHDDIMAVKLLRKTTKSENQDYYGNTEFEGGYVGKNVKNGEELYLMENEIICQLN